MELKKFLDEYEVSMTDFAEIAGLSKATIHNVISQKRKKISLETAVKIQLATENRVLCADLFGIKHLSILGKAIESRIEHYRRRYI